MRKPKDVQPFLFYAKKDMGKKFIYVMCKEGKTPWDYMEEIIQPRVEAYEKEHGEIILEDPPKPVGEDPHRYDYF